MGLAPPPNYHADVNKLSPQSTAVSTLTRRLFALNVVAQCAIVVTGALVRLTGSGLGCPTWPDCAEGSLIPVQRQAEGFHKYIEFGNRLLTFVLAVVIIASIIAAIRHKPRRTPLVILSASLLLGVVAQAVLGGITVLTGLNPYSVAAHFLVSIVMIALATTLYERGRERGDAKPTILVQPLLANVARLLVVVGLLVVVIGTVVTGSGPHSGDAASLVRFGLEPRAISWLHADVVIAFLGLTFALLIGLTVTSAPRRAIRAVQVLLVLIVLQGALGFTQYFLGVPELLVALHVVGACAIWWATLRIWFAMRTRLVAADLLSVEEHRST